jgi:cytoskeletal protein CcmA (bactofilin family)
MLQSPDNSQKQAPAQNAYVPVKTAGAPLEQATIGRSLVIKGEISGAESLFVDGKIEGSISLPEHRVTIGRNGNVAANVSAKEVVIMGKVHGNVECSDRLDLRSEGSLTISVEDGAILKGSIQVKSSENKSQNKHDAQKQQEAPKAMAATAGGNA